MAEEFQLKDEEAGKGAVLKWVMIALAILLVIAGSIAGTLLVLGTFDAEPVEASTEVAPSTLPGGKKPAIYVSIEPAFTVNFQGNSRARFLQVSVDVMTREPAMEENLKRHMPVIRNNLVMLFSSKTSGELSTLEGKQRLQAEALAAIQSVLEDETGHKGADAVFFTSFVMQ